MRSYIRGRYYSQAEVDEMISEYEGKLQRSYDIVHNLTYHMLKKNQEIRKLEFYLETLANSMRVVGDFMRERNNSN